MAYYSGSSILREHNAVETGDHPNSLVDYLQRTSGYTTNVKAHINGAAGSHTVNVFKVTAPVLVRDQWATLYEVTTLTNCTAVYADLYDGTNTEALTLNGATLSGFQNGSLFTKDATSTEAYTTLNADQCRFKEPPVDAKKLGKPFIIVPKNGADTYIRFHYTTTDDPIDFKLDIHFIWHPLDGGCVECLEVV